MKKVTDSRGVLHKKEILEFIIAKSLMDWKGVQVQEIVKRTKLSRPTVTTHLNELVNEDKIKKTNRGTYLSTEIYNEKEYNEWYYFECFLNKYYPFFVHNLGNHPIVNNLIHPDMADLVETIMNLIKDSDATKEYLKKYIFEYANRIGAYIVYVFIESLRSRRNVKSDDIRFSLTEHFLTEALPLMNLLEYFLAGLPINTKKKGHYELDYSIWKEVSKAYKQIYPYLVKFVQDGYPKYVNDHFSQRYRFLYPKLLRRKANCIHEWKKIKERHIHKIGYLYNCTKCDDIIVASPKDIGETAGA